MQFTLYYRGELRSNAKRKAKHELRKCFHRQLKQLWQSPPLSDFAWLLRPATENQLSLLENKDPFVCNR